MLKAATALGHKVQAGAVDLAAVDALDALGSEAPQASVHIQKVR